MAWADLSANGVYVTYQALMDKVSGRDWLALGSILLALPDGRAQGDSALQVAVLLDESLAAEADAVRAAAPPQAESGIQADATGPADRRDSSMAGSPEPLAISVGPRHDADGVTWGDVDAARVAELVAMEKAIAQRVSEKLGLELNLIETDYFLFYTDLPPKEAYEWQRLLDLMYQRVSYLLEIPEGVNVFKGKALVFFFKDKQGFVDFEREFYQNSVTYEAGICHQHFSGEVRIAFYQIDDEPQLRQVMVHEAAHGVVHRFRSPRRIDSWLNEGIAEWTAYSVINYKQPFKWKKQQSAEAVKQAGRIDPAFFSDQDFKPDFYGTSLAMVELLLRRGRPKFIAFIHGIKDGLTWQESLAEHYDMSPDELVRAYGRSIGARDLEM